MMQTLDGHRKDIDGLRALAVAGVFLFHLDIGLVNGGFVGVDVFFVISGYLVTSLIVRDIEKDRFSIGQFLFRRVKRIVPALVFMLAATLPIAAMILMPMNMMEAGRTALAALFFVSNLYFWKTVDYFSGDIDLYPYLHTWSLGVEWQFYLALPLGFWMLSRMGARRPRGLAVVISFALVMIASFLLNAVLVIDKPTGTYYFPATRFWEIMAGSMLALVAWRPTLTLAWRQFMAVTGFVLVAATMVLFDRETVFPGFNALIPVLGAMLLLVAGEGNSGIAGRALGMRGVTFVGLISYSFYLWHWPIIVLYKYAVLRPITVLDVLVITAITLAASWVSYKFVEEPFRKAKGFGDLVRDRRGYLLAASCAAFLFGGAIAMERSNHLQNDAPEMLTYLSKEYERKVTESYGMGNCFFRHDSGMQFDGSCLELDGHKRSIALIGDSHAAHLLPGIANRFPDAQIVQATVTGCRALLHRATAAGETCRSMRNRVYGDFVKENHPDLFILAGRWNHDDLEDLAPTLEWLNENRQKVLLVGPVIEYVDALPSILIRLERSSDQPAQDARLEKLRKHEVFVVDQAMRSVAQDYGVPYISSINTWCEASNCPSLLEGRVPVSWDYGHYTPEASTEFVTRVMDQMKSAMVTVGDENVASVQP